MGAERIVVGLSGGVDSAVAAARLVAAGHEVVGVHLALKTDAAGRGCGSPRDVADAQAVADALEIPLEVWDFADEFRHRVIDYFVGEYAAGRTPNPCLMCNVTVKFAALLDGARRRGFDAVATGHWARVGEGGLRRAVNRAKDQSYVLAVLSPEQLREVRFPLGDMASKDVARGEAAAAGLPVVADKPDSTDICFIPDGDTAGFLDRYLGESPGDIVDTEGNILGRHLGTHHFTVGQRKGLRLQTPAPDGKPRFVLGIEPDRRQVIVGPREAGMVSVITGTRPVWHDEPVRRDCVVQIRAHGAELPCRLVPTVDGIRAELSTPTTGVALGQGMVAYDGNRVVVQATISSCS